MRVTGLGFPVAGAMTSLALGVLAMLVVYRLFHRYVGPRAALVGVLVVGAFPASPVLQIDYTESLAVLLLAAALLLLVERRYLLTLPVVRRARAGPAGRAAVRRGRAGPPGRALALGPPGGP